MLQILVEPDRCGHDVTATPRGGRQAATVEAEVPGVDEGLFLEKAEAAKRDCAVSKALAGVEIGLEANLVEHAG